MKKGFTLIELLVVVLIIGILAAIALPKYEVAVEKSRAAEALMNVRTIKNAIELEILATGTCSGLENVDISIGTYGDGMFHTKYFEYENDGCYENDGQIDYTLRAIGRGLGIRYDRVNDKFTCETWGEGDLAHRAGAYKVCNSLCKANSRQSEDGDDCEL